MISNDTVAACMMTVQKTLDQRDNLTPFEKTCALLRGVHLMLAAGAEMKNGQLHLPDAK